MTKKQRNLLTHQDSYRLTKWLEEHREALTILTLKEIADKAREDLEIPVTEGNVRGAAKIIDLDYRSKRRAANRSKAAESDLRSRRILRVLSLVVEQMKDAGLEKPHTLFNECFELSDTDPTYWKLR